MPWRWSAYIDTKVRDTIARELLDATATLEPAKGEPLASVPLLGRTDTVVATAQAKGRAVRVAIHTSGGELLGSVPALEVCDRVEVEPGARVTLSLRLN